MAMIASLKNHTLSFFMTILAILSTRIENTESVCCPAFVGDDIHTVHCWYNKTSFDVNNPDGWCMDCRPPRTTKNAFISYKDCGIGECNPLACDCDGGCRMKIEDETTEAPILPDLNYDYWNNTDSTNSTYHQNLSIPDNPPKTIVETTLETSVGTTVETTVQITVQTIIQTTSKPASSTQEFYNLIQPIKKSEEEEEEEQEQKEEGDEEEEEEEEEREKEEYNEKEEDYEEYEEYENEEGEKVEKGEGKERDAEEYKEEEEGEEYEEEEGGKVEKGEGKEKEEREDEKEEYDDDDEYSW